LVSGKYQLLSQVRSLSYKIAPSRFSRTEAMVTVTNGATTNVTLSVDLRGAQTNECAQGNQHFYQLCFAALRCQSDIERGASGCDCCQFHHGRIVMDEGQPGARIRVFAVSINTNGVRKSATSDEDGRFSFTGLSSAVYRIAIAHQGDLVESRSPESEHVLPAPQSRSSFARRSNNRQVLTSTGEPLVEGQ
jgi:hypothetical protein